MAEKTYPTWAEPCMQFIDYVTEVDSLTRLTYHGAAVVARLPDVYKIASGIVSESENDESTQNLDRARKMAKLAESEMANGFPLLHGHSIMGMWGSLEAMVEDLSIAWLEYNPSILDEPKLSKIRIPLIEFQKLSHRERLRFLVTELQRDLGLDLKSGATKFEPLLSILGLGGPVNEKVRNILFEAQNLRNVFAHRGGIADRRLVSNCPHLQYSEGDAVRINLDHFMQILLGLLMYGGTIMNRCRAIAGMKVYSGGVEGFEDALSFP